MERGIRAKVSTFSRHFVNAKMTKGKTCGDYANAILAKRLAHDLQGARQRAGKHDGIEGLYGLLVEGNAFSFIADWRAPKVQPEATKR